METNVSVEVEVVWRKDKTICTRRWSLLLYHSSWSYQKLYWGVHE